MLMIKSPAQSSLYLALLFCVSCTTPQWNQKFDALAQIEPVADRELLLDLPFQQAWLDKRESDFRPARVRLFAEKDAFLVLAVLSDDDIGSRASFFNDETVRTGDVFEIFIQTDPDNYYEFHVTPENQKRILKFTTESFEAMRRREIRARDAHLDDPSLIETHTMINRGENYWTVSARIPFASIQLDPATENPDLKFAFARYDMAHGSDEAILSATPDFPRRSFHIRSAWHPVQLKTP